MSVHNINNLSKFSPTNVDGNMGGGSSVPATSGSHDNLRSRSGNSGGGIDWFSGLNSGKAHTMSPQDQFGKNPPLEDIVNEIARHLGLED